MCRATQPCRTAASIANVWHETSFESGHAAHQSCSTSLRALLSRRHNTRTQLCSFKSGVAPCCSREKAETPTTHGGCQHATGASTYNGRHTFTPSHTTVTQRHAQAMVGTTYARTTPTGNSTTLSQRHPRPCCQSLCHPAFNMRERHAQQKGQTNCQPGSHDSRVVQLLASSIDEAMPPCHHHWRSHDQQAHILHPRNTQIPHTPHTLRSFQDQLVCKHNTDTHGNTHSTHTHTQR